MLMVSHLLRVAVQRTGAAELKAHAPGRFNKARAPVVVWNICQHCNMSCPHCYLAAGTAPSPTTLDTAGALAVLDRLADGGVEVIIFSGGEPLLREDLFTLIDRATARGISPHLSSNGTLITKAVADRLASAGVGYVGVSIDGQKDFNDKWRGLANGYDLAVAGLENARAAGMRTGLRITVTRRNADHVTPMFELARHLDCSRFYVSHLVYSGRAHALQDQDLTVDQTRAALVALFESAHRSNELGHSTSIVTGGNDSDGPLLIEWTRERFGNEPAAIVETLLRERGGNTAGENMICVDYRGGVHPDQFWRSTKLGDLRVQSLAEVFAHPLVADLRRRSDLLEGRCGVCRFKPMCRGSHRERAEVATGRIWAPDPACVMTDAEIGSSPVDQLISITS